MSETGRDNYERARDLVMKYGWNTTCFQIVNPGIDYWFGPDNNSVVGYVSSGHVRVVAGAPVCLKSDLDQVASQFESDAAASGQRVCYFGAESRLGDLYQSATDHSSVLLGAQPVWFPNEWNTIVSQTASLRAQINRARNKGVTVSEWPIARAHNDQQLRNCLSSWIGTKGLPPLHFVIEPETLLRLENRRVFVADLDSMVVAFLVLSPIPQRSGWLTEQFPHMQGAPNGCVELMMDTAIRTLANEGCKYLTLGLSPLSKRAKIEPFDNPIWLRILLEWMRRHGQRFYNFEGLDHFKAKLKPCYWEPVFAISNEPKFSRQMIWSIALAFTQNRPFSVAGRGLTKALAHEFGIFRKWITGLT
jgi:phosphatidylglycerol lysyltransferase